MNKECETLCANVRDLAEALKSTKEYADYIEAREKLSENALEMAKFNKLKEMESRLYSSEDDNFLSFEAKRQFDELYFEIAKNEDIAQMLTAEYKFNRIVRSMRNEFCEVLDIEMDNVNLN